MPYNGGTKLIMTFQRIDMMSFNPTNLTSIIQYKKDTITAFYIMVHNLTTRIKVSHKGPSYHYSRSHISFINTILRGFRILSKYITYSLSYMHQEE